MTERPERPERSERAERTTGARPASPPDPVLERLRRPIHVGTLLGVSTGLYAATLAGVAVLQQHADDDLTAARAPAVAQAAELRASNDRLAQLLDETSGRERDVSRSYEAVRGDVGEVEAALTDLAAVVGDVKGAAAALPTRISLPAMPSSGSIRSTKAPATHATTGASSAP